MLRRTQRRQNNENPLVRWRPRLSKARLARIKKMYEDGNIELRETDITADEMLKNLVYGSVAK